MLLFMMIKHKTNSSTLYKTNSLVKTTVIRYFTLNTIFKFMSENYDFFFFFLVTCPTIIALPIIDRMLLKDLLATLASGLIHFFKLGNDEPYGEAAKSKITAKFYPN